MNDHNIVCEYADGIISYLYGEMLESERNLFEEHLAACDECTDEFAEVAVARYSVYEWNKLEFVNLETPRIVIPYEVNAVLWVDRLRAVFSFGYGLPAASAGLAVAAIVIGFLFFGSRVSDDNRYLAVANSSNDQSNIRAVPASDNTAAPRPSDPSEARVSAGTDDSVRRPVPIKITETLPRKLPVRNKTTAPAKQPRSVPRLNEFTEDEDKTLRLAEMLDDIETSE